MKIAYSLFLIFISFCAFSQEKTIQERERKQAEALAGVRVINAHAVTTMQAKHLNFNVQSRFGELNEGAETLFGLDNATSRISLDYGVNKNLMVGVGRASLDKTYDTYAKYRIFRQSSGKKSMPISVSILAEASVFTVQKFQTTVDALNRTTYCSQLIIERKMDNNLSLQVSPTVLHRNITNQIGEANTVFACAAAGRYRLGKSLSFTTEYVWVAPNQLNLIYKNPISFGLDIASRGNVLQLFVTNAVGTTERQFISETTTSDMRLGFNFSRTFSFDK